MVKKMYLLRYKKTKYPLKWVTGHSPSEIRRRLGTYDKRKFELSLRGKA